MDTTIPGSYISTGVFAETYTGIDITVLGAGELARAIRRASRWVDEKCRQTVYGTLDTVILGENYSNNCYTVDLSSGITRCFPRNFPIRAVDSLTIGYNAADVPQVVDSSQLRIFPRHIEIDSGWLGRGRGGYINLTYENGLPVSVLSQAAPLGASTISVKSYPSVGFSSAALASGLPAWMPGDVLEIQDSAPEIIVIQSVSGNTVTLATPLVSGHAADAMVASPLLANVQQATINVTSYLIKTRGVGPVSLRDEDIGSEARNNPEANLLADAVDLLSEFIAYA